MFNRRLSMKQVLSFLIAAAAMTGLALPASAQTGGDGNTRGNTPGATTWKAIAAGALEAPPNASPASSIVTLEVSGDLSRVFVDAPFRDLTGATVDAHIHCCTTTPFSGVAPVAVPFQGFPTGVRAGTYTGAVPLGAETSYDPAFLAANGGTPQGAAAALLDAIAANEAYVNIHTTAFPNGEIRGFIVAAPIPEPGEWAMLAGGLGALAWMRRRRPA
jgi:CHRD domain